MLHFGKPRVTPLIDSTEVATSELRGRHLFIYPKTDFEFDLVLNIALSGTVLFLIRSLDIWTSCDLLVIEKKGYVVNIHDTKIH